MKMSNYSHNEGRHHGSNWVVPLVIGDKMADIRFGQAIGCAETVNYINAPVIAKERGIKVIESKSSEIKDYTTMIALTVKTSKEISATAGTVFGKNDLRIVRVNEFSVEIVPEGYMLAVSNDDRPGVVGNLGTMLGDNKVNIARLHLSRDAQAKRALVVLNTDSPVPSDVLDKLRKLPHVLSVIPIKMQE